MTPKVSVIMSAFNQASYLKLAIDSILRQSFTNFKFIIINDASTDNTRQIINSYRDHRIKIITHNFRQGLAKSLNQAIKHAQAKYLARMDADDIACRDRLKTQLDYLETHPQIAACGTAVTLIDAQNRKIGIKHFPATTTKIRQVILRYNPFIHPSMMLQRKILVDVGGYDESLNGAEDYDLWLRMASKYELININKLLLNYRINPQGVSWANLKYTELQALKARIKALRYYDYSWWQTIYLIKPLLSIFVPGFFKKKFFHIP